MKKTKQRKSKDDIIYKLIYAKNKMEVFNEIPVNNQGSILLNMPKKRRQKILDRLDDDKLLNLLHYLSPDEITDLLQTINPRRKRKILKRLSKDMREKVDFLLKFDPRTAAGMMNLDYIEVEKNMTFERLSKIIKKHEQRTGKFPRILVVENGLLIGELPAYILALRKRRERIGPYIKKVPTIRYDADENEVIKQFRKHKHDKLIVLDDDDSILGIIYSDDILRTIEKKTTDSLYGFAGVSKEEDIYDSPLTKVKNRYKWLIINLGTAFLAACVVALFQNTISSYVLLAVYMPIVAGMGGNAGTQTLAVVVRGLALKEIELKTAKKAIINEVIAGAINGMINGLIVAVVAFLWNGSFMLGLIIGISMIINLIIAGFFGALIPLILKHIGKDPASSATIFITTTTDVFGFLVFLGLASIML